MKDDVTSDGGGGGASESSAVKQALSPRRSTSSLDSDLSEFAGGRRMEGLLQALSNEKMNPGGHFLFTAPVETGSWADMNTGHLCRSLGREVYQHAMNEAGLRIVGEYEDSGRNHYYATEKLLD